MAITGHQGKPSDQENVFGFTTVVAPGDSAHQAVDEGGTQFGLLQYVGPVRPE
jgi:hypothetical protein